MMMCLSLMVACGEEADEATNCISESASAACEAEDLVDTSGDEEGEVLPIDAVDSEDLLDLTGEEPEAGETGVDIPLLDLETVEQDEMTDEVFPDLVFDGVEEPAVVDLLDSEEMTPDITLDHHVSDGDTAFDEVDGTADCGDGVLPVTSIRQTEGIAIAEDGTFYYSQPQAVGRVRGGTDVAENNWVELPGEFTVWGLAYREDGMLYAAGVSRGIIYEINTADEAPTSTVFATGAGQPNGLIVGPDGLLFYSDFAGGHVYSVDESGESSRVDTGSPMSMPNGLFYDDDGALLVLEYGSGDIWRLTLSGDYEEEDRSLLGTVPGGGLDGIGKDITGRYYITNNSTGQLLRYDAEFTSLEFLMGGITAAANLVFGQGEVNCNDVYVASSNNLGRYEGDSSGRP